MNQEFNDQLPAELLLQLVRERYPGIAEVSIPRSLIFFFFFRFSLCNDLPFVSQQFKYIKFK